mmetsp:Transcript_29875/g.82022  ORF Transcript_29875/g.82022 Transcript_29875/m.82022 type:complete len:156 (-) Transcript_29875:86-553(-)|eukprot:CAMPEP_0168741692 /NCGR_PEP_ID=MMETSP0724-20121128/12653_1 /TAXON_ID=265536 /ORGANISM="Amphiprora sp., Strain CCMP467" /LENGTH=155 /DNA_ID=CAMNT_0008789221 /DNA_START=45 /DNA_END=512 /DNA_ORIENTATION=+
MTFRLALLSLCFYLGAAFSPVAVQNAARPANTVSLHMTTTPTNERRTFLSQISLICGGIAALAAVAQPAQAVSASTLENGSSSMLVADAIKTLDMSLPTYGDISSSKASVDNVKSLSVDPSKVPKGIPASQSKKSTSSKPVEKKKKKTSVSGYVF